MQPPKITDNGWFKFAERMLVLTGIPISLALAGWILSSINELGKSIVEIKTVQEQRIMTDIETILEEHDNFSTKEDVITLKNDIHEDVVRLEDQIKFYLYSGPPVGP